jgi:hypothetical protein
MGAYPHVLLAILTPLLSPSHASGRIELGYPSFSHPLHSGPYEQDELPDYFIYYNTRNSNRHFLEQEHRAGKRHVNVISL